MKNCRKEELIFKQSEINPFILNSSILTVKKSLLMSQLWSIIASNYEPIKGAE